MPAVRIRAIRFTALGYNTSAVVNIPAKPTEIKFGRMRPL